MASESVDEAARGRVPDRECVISVGAGYGQTGSIGAQRETLWSEKPNGKHMDELPGRRRPEPHRAVIAAGGKPAAVAAIGDAVYPSRVGVDRTDGVAG